MHEVKVMIELDTVDLKGLHQIAAIQSQGSGPRLVKLMADGAFDRSAQKAWLDARNARYSASSSWEGVDDGDEWVKVLLDISDPDIALMFKLTFGGN